MPQTSRLLAVAVAASSSAALAATAAGAAGSAGAKHVWMVPMAETDSSENFLYMGGELFGKERGNCTLMPGMGFFGELTKHHKDEEDPESAGGGWTFNTTTPWYYPTSCPGCVPMPKDNTTMNFVWLDFKTDGSGAVAGALTVGTTDGSSMAVPLNVLGNCSRVDTSPTGEVRATLVWAMEDFHPPGSIDPANPPNCDEDVCMDDDADATLWGRLVLYQNTVPTKPTPGLN